MIQWKIEQLWYWWCQLSSTFLQNSWWNCIRTNRLTTVSPECTNYIGGFVGMLPRKRKKNENWTLGNDIPCIPWIERNTSILLSFQFSVSLFIIPVRCFQSHFKVKQIASYSTEVTPYLQPVRVLFNRAIQLWLCNSVNITCKAIVFQAVLNISVTQNPLVRARRPKAPRKL